MNCPRCQQPTEASSELQCEHCGQSYPRDLVEKLNFLSDLDRWLAERKGLLGDTAKLLVREVEGQRKALREQLGIIDRPPEQITLELRYFQVASQLLKQWVRDYFVAGNSIHKLDSYLVEEMRQLNFDLAGKVVKIDQPSDLELLDWIIDKIHSWLDQSHTVKDDSVDAFLSFLQSRREALLTPAEALPSKMPTSTTTAEEAAAGPSVPVAPPKARREIQLPTVEWGKLWEGAVQFVVSGMLLRGLLYLGAFMIVVSAGVLVVLFWDVFPPGIQLLFIALVPTAFYLAGWGVGRFLKLPEASAALTGIGALLVAVDFGAVYQFGGVLEFMPATTYWTVAAFVCSTLYWLTAWRNAGVFFDYLAWIGVYFLVFSVTRLFNLPLEWGIVSVAFVSGTAVNLVRPFTARGGWLESNISALRLLPQVLLPGCMAVLLFVPNWPDTARSMVFLAAAVGYGSLAMSFPGVIFFHGALWTFSIGVFFLQLAVRIPLMWAASLQIVLSLFWVLSGDWWVSRTDDERAELYRSVSSTVGYSLLAAGTLVGFGLLFVDYWVGVVTLALAAAHLSICALSFKQPRFTAMASGLAIVPILLSAARWLASVNPEQMWPWLMAIWCGLAFIYLTIASYLRQQADHAGWFYFWVHLVSPVALLCLIVAFSAISASDIPSTLIAVGLTALLYGFIAILFDRQWHPGLEGPLEHLPFGISKSLFMWPLGGLATLWMGVLWFAVDLDRSMPGLTFSLLGLLYVGVAYLLARREEAYFTPWRFYAYVVLSISILLSSGGGTPQLIALYASVISLGAIAWKTRNMADVGLAALFLIWPFHITLDRFNLAPHGYSLGYSLLALLFYFPIGWYLEQRHLVQARIFQIIGYSVAALALVFSILCGVGVVYTPVSWVGFVVPLLGTILCALSVYVYRSEWFAWASGLALFITWAFLFELVNVPSRNIGACWMGAGILQLLLFYSLEGIARRENADWVSGFRRPLVIGAWIQAALSVGLSSPATFNALAAINPSVTRTAEYLAPLILTSGLGLVFILLSVWIQRSHWPLYLEPPLTLLFLIFLCMGFAKQILGSNFGTYDYALLSSVIGISHWLLAFGLDSPKRKHSDGLYVGAYVFAAAAIPWSVPDTNLLIWTFGLGLLCVLLSGLSVQMGRLHAWERLIHYLRDGKQKDMEIKIPNPYWWLFAWGFPIWLILLLGRVGVQYEFTWIGTCLAPIGYLILLRTIRNRSPNLNLPFNLAAHFYTVVSLLAVLPATGSFLFASYHPETQQLKLLGVILVQLLATVFYGLASWSSHRPKLTHVAAWLTFFPVTLTWRWLFPATPPVRYAWVWMGWATVLLLGGAGLDQLKDRYAHGPYLAGYLLAGLSLAWSLNDRLTLIYSLGSTILLAIGSQLWIHLQRHRSFDDLIQTLKWPSDELRGVVGRSAFLGFAAYALPIWLVQVLRYYDLTLSERGLALAILAPIYLGLGKWLERIDTRLTWPLYSAGFTLTAIGAMLSFTDIQLATYVVAIDAVVYLASAVIFQQSFWQYLGAFLIPIDVLLVLYDHDSLVSAWVSPIFMALALLYFGAGVVLHRGVWGRRKVPSMHSFAPPFLFLSFLLSAVALGAASGDRSLAIAIYSIGAVLYTLAAWIFQEAIFLYLVPSLAAVPYFLGVTLTPIEPRWYGLAWLPYIVSVLVVGRYIFHRDSLWIESNKSNGTGKLAFLAHPAIPFYLMGYGVSVSMLALSAGDSLTLSLAFAAAGLVYFGSAFMLSTPAWLYPAFISVHLAILTAFTIHPSGTPARFISLPFLGLTWVMALLGFWVDRRFPAAKQTNEGRRIFRLWRWELNFGKFPVVGYLATPSWAQPVLVLAALDVVIWQCVALLGMETTFYVGAGNALLLALFATLWKDHALAHLSPLFLTLGMSGALGLLGFAGPEHTAAISGIGLGFYLLSLLLQLLLKNAPKMRAMWDDALTRTSFGIATAATVRVLPGIREHPIVTAAALGFCGGLYLATAYIRRRPRLSYLGMAMLEVAWVVMLLSRNVRQPQLYAIPAGLYFTLVGILEQGQEHRFLGRLLEGFGLAVILITSFGQSLDSEQGFPYFMLLLVEGLLVIWWGAARRRLLPFYAGIGASVLNVIAQIVIMVRVYEINRWFIFLGVGLVLITTAIFVERRREQIIETTREWRQQLETWD